MFSLLSTFAPKAQRGTPCRVASALQSIRGLEDGRNARPPPA